MARAAAEAGLDIPGRVEIEQSQVDDIPRTQLRMNAEVLKTMIGEIEAMLFRIKQAIDEV
jgi:hypothetical protein